MLSGFISDLSNYPNRCQLLTAILNENNTHYYTMNSCLYRLDDAQLMSMSDDEVKKINTIPAKPRYTLSEKHFYYQNTIHSEPIMLHITSENFTKLLPIFPDNNQSISVDADKAQQIAALSYASLLDGTFRYSAEFKTLPKHSVAPDNTIWPGNFGWGNCPTCLPDGSVSQFTPQGIAISGPGGYQSAPPNDLDRVQGVVADASNNLWMASFSNDKVVAFRNGNPNDAVSYPELTSSHPFAIAIDSQGRAWVTNNGSADLQEGSSSQAGSVSVYGLSNLGMTLVQQINDIGWMLKAVAIDSIGNIWVASTSDTANPLKSSVYQINGTTFAPISNYTGGGIAGPWGLAIDGNDHIWVGNFESRPLNEPFKARISELCGNQPTTCPSGSSNPGDAISPTTGYTLPSGGAQVLLPNGQPLGGENQPPSYTPLMRQTFVMIDPAGNVWVTNNWKANPITTTGNFNPGGDGLVALVGMAKPKNG